MKILSLYQDFFHFLDKIQPRVDKWELYFSNYYHPYEEFLGQYFSKFPLLDPLALKQRVEAIKPADYSLLRDLISSTPPEGILQEAYEKCKSVVSSKEEPEAYLFIGFFSPDAFVMEFRGKPVICFGLERYKDFRLLKILFAHEYAHYLLNISEGEVPEREKLKWLLISEGVGTYLSTLVFPNNYLYDHCLFNRARLNWVEANEGYLREIFCSGKFSQEELMDFYFKGNPEMNIPPRAGKYLGYMAVKRYFTLSKEKDISSLFSNKKKALSLKL